MNAKQTNVIEVIKAKMINNYYEIKIEKVEDCGHFVSLVLEVGMVDDEGTMAEIICRNRRHFFIGKRGGVTLKSVSMSNKFASPKSVTGLSNSVHFLPF